MHPHEPPNRAPYNPTPDTILARYVHSQLAPHQTATIQSFVHNDAFHSPSPIESPYHQILDPHAATAHGGEDSSKTPQRCSTDTPAVSIPFLLNLLWTNSSARNYRHFEDTLRFLNKISRMSALRAGRESSRASAPRQGNGIPMLLFRSKVRVRKTQCSSARMAREDTHPTIARICV